MVPRLKKIKFDSSSEPGIREESPSEQEAHSESIHEKTEGVQRQRPTRNREPAEQHWYTQFLVTIRVLTWKFVCSCEKGLSRHSIHITSRHSSKNIFHVSKSNLWASANSENRSLSIAILRSVTSIAPPVVRTPSEIRAQNPSPRSTGSDGMVCKSVIVLEFRPV